MARADTIGWGLLALLVVSGCSIDASAIPGEGDAGPRPADAGAGDAQPTVDGQLPRADGGQPDSGFDAGPDMVDAGFDAGFDAGPPPCDTTFGAEPSYQRCAETATECTFYTDTPGGSSTVCDGTTGALCSCDAICGAAGRTCVAVYGEGGNSTLCTWVDGAETCGRSYNDMVCVCTR